VAFLPEFMGEEDVEAGRLVQVLPEWGSTPSRYSAVFPDHRIPSPIVKAFLGYMAKS
jgi:DNA-binding transcriptional LysR family regulator